MLGKDSIAQLLRAGSNVRMKTMTRENLIELAHAAKSSNVHLEIVGTMGVETLVEVARAGGKNVTFDISD